MKPERIKIFTFFILTQHLGASIERLFIIIITRQNWALASFTIFTIFGCYPLVVSEFFFQVNNYLVYAQNILCDLMYLITSSPLHMDNSSSLYNILYVPSLARSGPKVFRSILCSNFMLGIAHLRG